MKKIMLLPALLLAMIFLLAAVSANAATPLEGYWLTQNERSVIRVEECDKGLCGYIHWIIEGGMQTDSKNPDESMRDRPMCGMPILWGMSETSGTQWENGKIYKADDGDIYDADLTLQPDDSLKVRGYRGITLFGKTQIWNRVSAENYPACTK
jgi:uncharacterized protein (DUF2147 family)